MKKNFQKPQARVYEIVEEEGILLGASIEISPDSDPVEDESSIGFSRENTSQNQVWDN